MAVPEKSTHKLEIVSASSKSVHLERRHEKEMRPEREKDTTEM